MNAVEFLGKIKKGQISLPKELLELENSSVRVIVLIENELNPTKTKTKLLNVFKKMKEENMFSSIENPVLWQKNLRNEWE